MTRTGSSALWAALVCCEVEVRAIERPEGLLVDRLLESGVRVLALHPNQVKAARDRFRASGGKSDRFDRFVLCELARTDADRFRILEPDSDQTKAIRALTRAREDLVATRVSMANQLRSDRVSDRLFASSGGSLAERSAVLRSGRIGQRGQRCPFACRGGGHPTAGLRVCPSTCTVTPADRGIPSRPIRTSSSGPGFAVRSSGTKAVKSDPARCVSSRRQAQLITTSG